MISLVTKDHRRLTTARPECVGDRGDAVWKSFDRQITTPAATLASGQGAHHIQAGTCGLQGSDRHSVPILSAATSPQQPIVEVIVGATLCRTVHTDRDRQAWLPRLCGNCLEHSSERSAIVRQFADY